jgi:colanic acid biosynthesis glycosyl transferase WcaI
VRIAVHDYAGHPFQVHLSRELARRGHQVLHLHCPSVRTGKGALSRRHDDPSTFQVDGVSLDGEFERYALLKRAVQERAYGKRLVRRLSAFRPDLVLSANTPLLAQAVILRHCARAGVGFVFWQQDVLGVGIKRVLRKRSSLAGSAFGEVFVMLERRLLKRSDAVVTISEDFEQLLLQWRVSPRRISVIENWAPIEQLPVLARDNSWAREQGLVDKRVVLYSGTLGLKHNPGLLLELACRLGSEPDVRIVVVSEGLGAEWLKTRAAEDRLTNIIILGYQPYERFAEVLASGDVLAVVLEDDAGVFSVPSKVLSYHCAGRALVGALPSVNLAARMLRRNRSGLVVEPADVDGFVEAP